MNKVFFTHCGAFLGIVACAAMSTTAYGQQVVQRVEAKPAKVVVRTVTAQKQNAEAEESVLPNVEQQQKITNRVHVRTKTHDGKEKTLVVEKRSEGGKERLFVNGKEVVKNADGSLPADVQKELESIEAELANIDVEVHAAEGDNESGVRVFRLQTNGPDDKELQHMMIEVEKAAKESADAAAETNKAVQMQVFAVGADGDDKTHSVTVERTVENGKERIVINGKEIDIINGKDIDIGAVALPEDIEKMVEQMTKDAAESNAMVFQWQNDSDAPTAPIAPVEPTSPDAVPAPPAMPTMKFFTMGKGKGTCKMALSLNAEEMKKRCADMKEKCKEMAEKCKEMKEKMGAECKAWKLKFDTDKMWLDSSLCHSAVRTHAFVMKFDNAVDGDNGDVVVKRIETDDLGDVEELFIAPENGSTEKKRFKVIIVERKDTEADDSAVEGTEQSKDAPVAPEQNGMEKTRVEPLQPNEVDLQTEYFNVFPNPTQGILNVSIALQQSGPITLTVTDVLGNEVYRETVDNYNAKQQLYRQVNLAEKAKGTYFVRVESNGQSFSRQVAVQ